jgi:hypothetical protein
LFEVLAGRVEAGEIDPLPRSGHQELLESVVNQGIWSADQAKAPSPAPSPDQAT